jgi:hypothetical protein
MPEAMATDRSRRPRPRWGWSGSEKITWPERIDENLDAVLNLLPAIRSSRADLTRELASLGARCGRYLHQDEFGPTRAEQMAALRQLRGALKVLNSCLAELPEAQHMAMSQQFLMRDDYRDIASGDDVGVMQAYENDCKAVKLIALAIVDVERNLRGLRLETMPSTSPVSEAVEKVFGLVQALDTSTADQIATFDQAPCLDIDRDADPCRLVFARVRRLQRLVEVPLARLERDRGPEPRVSLRWLVRELCAIWERETGQAVTSSAVEAYRYTGTPRSPAGKFVLAAVKALRPPPDDTGDHRAVRALYTDQTVHWAIQDYVRDHPPATGRRRGRPKRGCATI